jgi:hypothetical protein
MAEKEGVTPRPCRHAQQDNYGRGGKRGASGCEHTDGMCAHQSNIHLYNTNASYIIATANRSSLGTGTRPTRAATGTSGRLHRHTKRLKTKRIQKHFRTLHTSASHAQVTCPAPGPSRPGALPRGATHRTCPPRPRRAALTPHCPRPRRATQPRCARSQPGTAPRRRQPPARSPRRGGARESGPTPVPTCPWGRRARARAGGRRRTPSTGPAWPRARGPWCAAGAGARCRAAPPAHPTDAAAGPAMRW